MVSRLQEASDVAGVSSEVANAKMKAMREIKRDIEACIGSDNDRQQEAPPAPYKLRALGKWISNTPGSDVPAAFRTPTGNINSTATGSLSESAFNDVFQSIFDSEIIQRILDWAQQKALADERKQLRELNKSIGKEKVLKLVDAKGKDREKCTLGLFEGDSAMSFFRKFRDPSFQGAFPLRGKFINVTELPNTRVIQNQEVKDLLTAIGLKMGEEPKELRYGKVLIYSDADPDGDSIAGLLMNFFGRYWPELFDQGRICRVMTPLVVAKKGAETLSFYTNAEFEEWMGKVRDPKKWDIAYKKGLAALEDAEYKEIIQNPNMFSIAGGKELKTTLDTWFAGDSAPRKAKIMGGEEEAESGD